MENEYMLNRIIELLKNEAKARSEDYYYTASEADYSEGYENGLLSAVDTLEQYKKDLNYLKH